MSRLPLLSPSIEGEDLFLEELKVQRPVYYTSQAFQGAEVKYPQIKKMDFSLIIALRKLSPYFQVHTILVMMNQPIQKAMSRPNVARRMVQWAIELSEFDIKYKLRH